LRLRWLSQLHKLENSPSSEQRLGIEQIVKANQRNNEIVDRIYKQTQDLEVLSREMNQESTKLQKASRQLEQVIQ